MKSVALQSAAGKRCCKGWGAASLERYVDGSSVLRHCPAVHVGMADFLETPVGPETIFSFDKAFFFVLTFEKCVGGELLIPPLSAFWEP